jgi:hypothetical protein
MASKELDRSGWCLQLPVTKWNQEAHDKCIMHFQTRDCACDCGHKGERSLESRDTVFLPYITPKKKIVIKEEEQEENDNDDDTAA